MMITKTNPARSNLRSRIGLALLRCRSDASRKQLWSAFAAEKVSFELFIKVNHRALSFHQSYFLFSSSYLVKRVFLKTFFRILPWWLFAHTIEARGFIRHFGEVVYSGCRSYFQWGVPFCASLEINKTSWSSIFRIGNFQMINHLKTTLVSLIYIWFAVDLFLKRHETTR